MHFVLHCYPASVGLLLAQFLSGFVNSAAISGVFCVRSGSVAAWVLEGLRVCGFGSGGLFAWRIRSYILWFLGLSGDCSGWFRGFF